MAIVLITLIKRTNKNNNTNDDDDSDDVVVFDSERLKLRLGLF